MNEVRNAYNRAEYRLERTKMMQEYADWLEALLNSTDKVLELHGRLANES